MKLLISNDDGISAAGLNALIDILYKDHELYVAAPTLQKSASSHALTMQHPITVTEVMDPRVKKGWAVGGNPADCTKLALEELLGFRPDWVISGINHGPNLGTDLMYSGTVAAAAEGTLFSIPSIAVSSQDYSVAMLGETCVAALEAINWIFSNAPWGKTMMNVNIPNCRYTDMKGLKITHTGQARYDKPFSKRIDPRGNTYYWLAGELVLESETEDADVVAVRNRYISLSPINFAFDDWEANRALSKLL